MARQHQGRSHHIPWIPPDVFPQTAGHLPRDHLRKATPLYEYTQSPKSFHQRRKFSGYSAHVRISNKDFILQKKKSLVVNSLLLSRLWHVFRVVTVPKKWLDRVRSVIRDFVVPFSPAPSWHTLCLKKRNRGFNVVNVHLQQLALQLMYIQHLLSQESQVDFCTPVLKYLIHYYYGSTSWEDICRNHATIKKLVRKLPFLSIIICPSPLCSHLDDVNEDDYTFLLAVYTKPLSGSTIGTG